jgi:hypothetical protein
VEGQTDTTVAIVAIVATALAGVIGPTIAGLFARARQRAEQREARRMDTIAERRRLIYEALDQITAFEHTLTDTRKAVSADTMVTQFAAHRLRLMALFGPDSDVATAYQDCTNAVAVVVVMITKAEGPSSKQKISNAQQQANAARDRLVATVRPHLTAT